MMTTFPEDMELKGYTQDEVFAVLYESDQDRKRREMRVNVTETVNAHRLKEMKHLAVLVEVAAWRRMNGFDRDEVLVRDGLPLSPEEYTTYLLDEAQELRDAIYRSPSERNDNRMRKLMREMMRGRVIMEVTDDERGIIKQLVKERAERVHGALQVTVSSAETVQHCPDLPPDACIMLKGGESEGTVSPALKQHESSSAGTDIETPGQQSTPKGGNWEAGLINAGDSVLVGISSSLGVDSSSPPEKMEKTSISTGIFSMNTGVRDAAREEAAIAQHRQGANDENKQFDPGG